MNKKITRILSSLIIAVMLIGLLPTFALAADTSSPSQTVNSTVVPFAAPAVFADEGETIALSSFGVMFNAATITPAHKVTWSSDTLTVTNGSVTVAEKGVYTVTASSGADSKTVYIVVKQADETEYVLYEKDFSTVASWDELVSEGYTVPEKVSSHTLTVENSKFIINGKPHKNITQVILPWWLSAFGDYSIEADVAYTNREWTSRFWSISFNHQSNTSTGLYPYNYFKTSDPTANDNSSAVGVDGRTAQWAWQGGVDSSFAKDMYQTGEHNYRLDIYGSRFDAYIEGTHVLGTDYTKTAVTGGIGFFVRGATIEISNVKVSLDKERIQELYANLVQDSTPAVFADAGETVDLSKYSVTHNGTAVMSGESLTWASDEITVTDNKVTPASAGTYKMTAKTSYTTANGNVEMSRTVYLVVKNPTDTEYVLYNIDYSNVSTLDDLTTAGYVMAEIPDGFTVGIENGALAIKGDSTNAINLNARVILPEWLSDFADVKFSSDVKITKATNTNRYFSLTYRVQNTMGSEKGGYYPIYCASYRPNGLTNLSYAHGLNTTGTPDWKNGIDGVTTTAIGDGNTHNYAVELSGITARSYFDSTKIVEGNYIGSNDNSNFAKGYLGYFVRGLDIEIYTTKVTVKKPQTESFENVIPNANPVILANTDDTVDLSEYAVVSDDDDIIFDSAEWTTDDISIVNNEVTPTKAGVYTFTVSAYGESKNVYLLVKEPTDTEYELFEIDYSDVTSVDELTEQGFVIAEQANTFTVGIENEALSIKGAAANAPYKFCRIILPEWLGDFGNYSISSQVKTIATSKMSRYFALMYRVQNDASISKSYFPYYTASFRAGGYTNSYAHNLSYASTYANSTISWGTTGVTMAGTEQLLDDTVHDYTVSVYGNNVKVFFDDIVMTDSNYIGKNDSSNFDKGYLGYLVLDQHVEIYNTRVVYLPNETETATEMVDADEAESNVIMPASVVTRINALADLEAINGYTTAPATAILNVDGDMNVVDGEGNIITTVDKALSYLGKRVIPAFNVSDKLTTDAIINYVKENGLYDIFVVSDNAALLKRAKSGYNMIRNILDLSDRTISEDELYSIRKETNEASARICIMPSDLVSKKNVEKLLNLEMTVWVENDDTAVGTVKNITSGASGIITQDIDLTVGSYTKYFAENTMVRSLIYVGHQGVYTLEQPNTVSGMLRAYNLGAAALETDIHLSKDGVIISMHDNTLDRATNGTGYISDYTYEELKAFEVDQHGAADHEPIATLEDHFNAIKGLDVTLTVEIKTADNAVCQKLVDLINKYDIADQINVSTFDISQILLLKSLMPELSVGVLDGSLAYAEITPEEATRYMLLIAQKYDTNYCSTAAGLTNEVARAAFDRGYSISPSTTDNKPGLSLNMLNGALKICTNYTQYITDTVKELRTDKSEYFSNKNEIAIDVNAVAYSRTATPVTDAELIFIDGDDIFTYQNGNIVSSGDGSATLMFSYQCKTVADETYHVVTEPFTVTVESDPEITAEGNKATLSKDARRVYWGYIGEENIPYKWFNDFMAQCGDTFTSEYSPKGSDTYKLTQKGFYRFVVTTETDEYVYTVECTENDPSAITMTQPSDATVALSGTARKVYYGYIGEENTQYRWFNDFMTQCGDSFTSDFSPVDGKAYRMEKEGYYRFVVCYLDENSKLCEKVFTFKCENANSGIPEVTYAEGSITLNTNDAAVNKMYIGYFGKDEVEVTSWADYSAKAVARTCIQSPADSYTTNLKNEGCYVILVNYTDENGKNKDKYFTFNN